MYPSVEFVIGDKIVLNLIRYPSVGLKNEFNLLYCNKLLILIAVLVPSEDSIELDTVRAYL